MLSPEEIHVLPDKEKEDDKRPLIMVEQNNQAGTLKKSFAIAATATSVIAVMPVPYLVLRSVFYLVTRNSQFTFKEMIITNRVVFWVFGPASAILATVAIAPFNMVNAYNTVINIQFTREGMHGRTFLKMLSGFFLTFTGAVNAYNINYALNDILQNHNTTKKILSIPCVSVGFLFAGISDARVFLIYSVKEIPQDYRYVKRGLKTSANQIMTCSFFKTQPVIHTTEKLTRRELLDQLRSKLDDLRIIILLSLTDIEINQFKHLPDASQWVNDRNSAEFKQYIQIFNKRFPWGRFLGSEVLGSTLSGLFGYYGNKNTYEYTYKALSDFLVYCGLSSENYFLLFSGYASAIISYITGFLVSFFLIRDLFFRDLFKITSLDEFKQRLPKLLISLIPALSFGLLNVILTALNDSLSPINKIIVSCAAVIGATVVTRYGIEGGIDQLRNSPNIRRELANITDKLMNSFIFLNYEELREINTQFSKIINPLQNITYIKENIKDDESSIEVLRQM
jgi:hypothetical protein